LAIHGYTTTPDHDELASKIALVDVATATSIIRRTLEQAVPVGEVTALSHEKNSEVHMDKKVEQLMHASISYLRTRGGCCCEELNQAFKLPQQCRCPLAIK
jgi:hypothetical protein